MFISHIYFGKDNPHYMQFIPVFLEVAQSANGKLLWFGFLGPLLNGILTSGHA